VNKLNEIQVFLHEKKEDIKGEDKVEYANLSPGEKSIFKLLIWQYMFKERAYMVKNAIMLFDEPDSHLHPSKVKYWIEELRYLSKLNVQIIITTHNPTTVSFIEKENLFLVEREGDKLSIKNRLSATEIYHKLTSRLVNIEAPSRKIFVEGKDAAFYRLIEKFLNSTNLVDSHFQLNFMPLPAGGDSGRRNKSSIIAFMNSVEPSNEDPDYDSIHSYYGIIDDDNYRLREHPETPKEHKEHKERQLKNLFVLNRYAKENYALDPINIYFYLRSLDDKKASLLSNINAKIDGSLDFRPLKEFNLIEIYQELQNPKKTTPKNIEKFLQMIVDSVEKKVFDILFKSEEKLIRFISDEKNENVKNFIDSLGKNKLHEFQKVATWKTMIKGWAVNGNIDEWDYILKSINEIEIVRVLDIQLNYRRFFTCCRGHLLDIVLGHEDMFTETISCDKIIEKFQQTGTGIFIPDEIINMYKTFCHNIIYDEKVIKLVKKKYRNTSFFILYNPIDFEEFKR